ncbi:alpha/beta fold hydrolase [Amycolatopsis sp. NPDC051903]|uniref:alpha/beta fold hydrolase n=1 Tax=Amycolatopsis sp. NPDC051903 TaxID=3363936 RepID=UPI0037B336B7
MDALLAHDILGTALADPLIIIQGLGDQLTKWDDGFPQALVARGFRVIRCDNRDVGLSPRCPGGYSLADMAGDTIALLDHVGVARAHVVGVSLGGMVAQLVAAEHPSRVLSLTSIMSSTGNPALSPPNTEVLTALTAPAPDPADEDAFAAHARRLARMMGSPAYPDDEVTLRATLLAAARWAHDPAGVTRQLAAAVSDGDRRERLARITAPVLVVHGRDDPLFALDHARDTAASVRGAQLLELPGMGHNLPRALYATVADAIAALRASPHR